jgi:hypothetical protein
MSLTAPADKYKGSIFLHQYKIVFLFCGARYNHGKEMIKWMG